ncbi:hypothetical protein FBR05_07665 [Deltaproteobacteria bacterium PRO3]|nr:hypothetical protein [Deltaproteobacteria bacterium PRO3]
MISLIKEASSVAGAVGGGGTPGTVGWVSVGGETGTGGGAGGVGGAGGGGTASGATGAAFLPENSSLLLRRKLPSQPEKIREQARNAGSAPRIERNPVFIGNLLRGKFGPERGEFLPKSGAAHN